MAPNETPDHLASNPFQDLSGVDASAFENPYDALLSVTEGNPLELQKRYSVHRTTRNSQQKTKLLDQAFSGVIIDPILEKLENPSLEPGFTDPRHCLVFWGRPPQHIKKLIAEVQTRLREAAPNLWLMPLKNLHITILEITHSKTAEEIEVLKKQIAPVADEVVNYTNTPEHQARLIKPMVGYDASALALSFLPAADEGDAFSYHHLRRDAANIVSRAGIKVDSRYVVPSAHLTIGRFVSRKDMVAEDGAVDPAQMANLVKTIEEINQWLESEFWGNWGSMTGDWALGDGDGLVLRAGTVWYGGGETVAQTVKK